MLATLPDYQALYGDVADTTQVKALLAGASSLMQEVAHQHIAFVADDEVVLYGDDLNTLFLPELPVVAVASVAIDGTAQDASVWRWRRNGVLRHRAGVWPRDAEVAVVYSHGLDPVPEWIVTLACSMVHRAVRPEALAGVQQQTTGSQSIAYSSTAAGANLWLTTAEAARLEGLTGPLLA